MNGTLIFEIVVLSFFVGMYSFMKWKKYKKVELKFLFLFLSVFFFEFISQPMWEFQKFSWWAYAWKGIPWIILIGWTCVFLLVFLVVDAFFGKMEDRKRFWIYLGGMELVILPTELCLVKFGIKKYTQILSSTFTGLKIPTLGMPLEIVLAIPLFTSLVICLYKYLNYLYLKK